MHVRSRRLLAASTVIAAIGAGLAGAPWQLLDADADGPRVSTAALAPPIGTVTIGGPDDRAPRIAPGFLGLSIEYPALQAYTGQGGQPLDPLFVRMLRTLAPAPVLRIGGDTADASWWPTGTRTPPSVGFTITREWLARLRAVTRATGAKLILGVNLKVGAPAISLAEAKALLAGVDRRSILALELGNEPSNYARFAAYRALGRRVFARPRGYRFGSFLREFARLGRQLPGVPLAGPTLGSSTWVGGLRRFIAAERGLRVVTLHRYPLSCFAPASSPRYASAANLATARAARRPADGMVRLVGLAHAAHLLLRVDELNSVSCGGRTGVSDSYSAALWFLDALFGLAQSGVDGVNVHTFPGAAYAPFSLSDQGGRWAARFAPPYLGMLLFTRAAPAGSVLLRVGNRISGVRAWATRTAGGATSVIVINRRPGGAASIAVSVAGIRPASAPASIEALVGPDPGARSGVTLAGQSFSSPSTTGQLGGHIVARSVRAIAGRYVFAAPPMSALLLRIPRHG